MQEMKKRHPRLKMCDLQWQVLSSDSLTRQCNGAGFKEQESVLGAAIHF